MHARPSIISAPACVGLTTFAMPGNLPLFWGEGGMRLAGVCSALTTTAPWAFILLHVNHRPNIPAPSSMSWAVKSL